jgi:hypothetical protein
MGGDWQAGVTACDDYVCLPDSANLFAGALIVHAPPGIDYTTGEDWCARYDSEYRISESAQQAPRIDPATPSEASVWYVIAAWSTDKVWSRVVFGLGDYDPLTILTGEWGVCNGGGPTSPSTSWPAPGEGLTIMHADAWSGNYEPVCWFVSYAYGAEQVPLCSYEQDQASGFSNQSAMDFPVGCYGALGVYEDGVACHPTADLAACCVGDVCALLSHQACSLAGGVWYAGIGSCDPDPCSPAEVPVESPTSYAPRLHATAPNPFTGQAEIIFSMPDLAGETSVQLEVYDLGGRRVRTLLKGARSPGRHRVLWDGTDQDGRPVEAGVYFCRLTVGSMTVARHMLRLK